MNEQWFKNDCEDHSPCKTTVEHRRDFTRFAATVYIKDFEEDKTGILSQFESLFIRFGGMVGYATNYFDKYYYQNAHFKGDLEKYNLPLDGVIFNKQNPWDNDIPIDIHLSFPGHIDYYGAIDFYPSYGMWFGPDYYRIFPEDKISSFEDCAENINLGNGFRRIFLFDNVMDYDTPKNRARQWAFRNHLNMCEHLRVLNNKGFVPKDESSKPNPSVVILKGEFEHGGDTLIKSFIDKYGNPCTEMEAAGYVYIESKNNIQIASGTVAYNDINEIKSNVNVDIKPSTPKKPIPNIIKYLEDSKKNVSFLASAYLNFSKIPKMNNASVFFCKILKGKISKGDMVWILDADKNALVEQKISDIQHSRKSVNAVTKGEVKNDEIWLTLYHIYDYLNDETMYYIVKF